MHYIMCICVSFSYLCILWLLLDNCSVSPLHQQAEMIDCIVRQATWLHGRVVNRAIHWM